MATMAEAVAPGVPTMSTGFRAGEKRHEQLLNAHEAPYATEWPTSYVLGPLNGRRRDELPEGFEYRSDTAVPYEPVELAAVLARLDSGEIVRTVGPDVFGQAFWTAPRLVAAS